MYLVAKINRKIASLNSLSFVALAWITSFLATTAPMFIVSRKRTISMANLLSNWDSSYLLQISREGYLRELPTDVHGKIVGNQNAFFPLFPFINRYLDAILPGGAITSGIVFNWIIWFFTLYVFYKLAIVIFEDYRSRYAVLLLAFFPGSFIVFWVYSEALTIFLIVSALYLLKKNHPMLSALLFGFASFSRPNAFPYAVVIPAFLLLTILLKQDCTFKQRIKKTLVELPKAIVYFFISGSGFVIFQILQWRLTSIPNAWLRIEREAWGESTKPFEALKSNFSRLFNGNVTMRISIVLVSAIISIALLVVLVFFAYKKLNDAFSLAMVPSAAIVTLLGLSNGPATASLRFTIIAIPVFIAAATITTRKAIYFLLPISLCLLCWICYMHSWGFAEPFLMGSP